MTRGTMKPDHDIEYPQGQQNVVKQSVDIPPVKAIRVKPGLFYSMLRRSGVFPRHDLPAVSIAAWESSPLPGRWA